MIRTRVTGARRPCHMRANQQAAEPSRKMGAVAAKTQVLHAPRLCSDPLAGEWTPRRFSLDETTSVLTAGLMEGT